MVSSQHLQYGSGSLQISYKFLAVGFGRSRLSSRHVWSDLSYFVFEDDDSEKQRMITSSDCSQLATSSFNIASFTSSTIA